MQLSFNMDKRETYWERAEIGYILLSNHSGFSLNKIFMKIKVNCHRIKLNMFKYDLRLDCFLGQIRIASKLMEEEGAG